MLFSFRDALEDNAVRLYEDFTCIYKPPVCDTQEEVIKDMKSKMMNQLLQFMVLRKTPGVDQQGFTKIRLAFSGKASGADDLAMVIQLCHYWRRYFDTSPQFQEYAMQDR
jgi:hypothetical protein